MKLCQYNVSSPSHTLSKITTFPKVSLRDAPAKVYSYTVPRCCSFKVNYKAAFNTDTKLTLHG